ncbi:MAG: hypothetical protein ACO3MW_01705 [Rhodospirillales bacterium]|jgi:hypothetical protein
MDIKRELALLKSKSGKERAKLLKEPPKKPTRKQLEILNAMNTAGGTLPADKVHYRTGLILTARRWARLHQKGDALVFTLTEAGRSVIESQQAV